MREQAEEGFQLDLSDCEGGEVFSSVTSVGYLEWRYTCIRE